ncbi:MBL fold metallo-hydrolase [Yinghuangia seranimata]|uniref:MBL fold metallo-hydrolase n=1 Tax=Yinghuangia seranimata TaxID=408067 RepID=UPI00248BFF95|nr:MBL fold metallo-hydrolase [Yinghuangia seranimata]MDI2130707.1 MBL fold metallo-hydrolase [Yinghuangia seranimata]
MTHPSAVPPHARLLERGHPFRQWKTWMMPGTGHTLNGYSRANDKTFFHIPELRCSLDAGLCEGRQVDTVLLTHTHLDHVKDLDFLAANPAGADIYVPAEALTHVEAYLRASVELNHGAAYDPSQAPDVRLHPVRDGDEFVFGRRRGHRVRVVGCDHKVPCVGYAVSELGKALVPELAELRRVLAAEGRAAEFGKTVAARRKAGEVVEQEVSRPLFAFLGDTHASVYERNPWLFDYPVLIAECTYLDDAERERAKRVGHTLWSELEPVVAAHPETLFVLTHFSLRHSDREVVEFFRTVREKAEGRLDNVMAWAHPESSLPEQHQQGPH